MNDAELTDRLLAPVLGRPTKAFRVALGVSAALTALLVVGVVATLRRGIAAWGNNAPVGWGFEIVNFVWWIGLGHAGTFISAVLLLLGARWRSSVSRLAEAMTLFAVVQAAIFPLLHLGRPSLFYWLLPYPSSMGVWPQTRSPIPWDTAAIASYFTVSVLFCYVGLLPDLASARDRATGRLARVAYGLAALGWRGSARHWSLHRTTSLLLAGLATPLVVSVHSVVALDFAVSLLPGWHSTLLPLFFVAGAIFSGFAAVLTILIPLRRASGLQGVVTPRHLDAIARLLLATGLVVTYGYAVEIWSAARGGDPYELYLVFVARPTGPAAIAFWLMLACNVAAPQLLWSARLRRRPAVLLGVAIAVDVGMWAERFVIVVASLGRDFLPAAWRAFAPTWVDLSIFAGTLGLFSLLFLLFLRRVPAVPIAEAKQESREPEPPAAREAAS